MSNMLLYIYIYISWVKVIPCILRTQTIYIVSLRVSIKYLSISEIKRTCEELQCFELRSFLVHIQTHLNFKSKLQDKLHFQS